MQQWGRVMGRQKYNHRCEELDQHINKYVRVIFKNDSWIEGILIWNDWSKAPLFLRRQSYYIVQNNGCYYQIHKTNIKSIKCDTQGE